MGQDFLVPQDKETEVSSLSRDKGTMGQKGGVLGMQTVADISGVGVKYWGKYANVLCGQTLMV